MKYHKYITYYITLSHLRNKIRNCPSKIMTVSTSDLLLYDQV